MTKVLYVTGDSDFSAECFEESKYFKDLGALWVKGKEFQLLLNEGECSEEEITIECLEFGPIDDDFIDFLRLNILDYDQSKANNFYIVDEGG